MTGSVIFLIQTDETDASKSYHHYETLEEFVESAVLMFEQNLTKRNKERGITTRIVYDLGDIVSYFSALPDCGLLIMDDRLRAYVPHGPSFVVSHIVKHLRQTAAKG